MSPNKYRKAKRKQKIIMTATVDRRRKYATEEERLEAKRAQRRINDRKYYHQNPKLKLKRSRSTKQKIKKKLKLNYVRRTSKKKFKRF